MTELGDAELTEQQVMTLSTHKPSAARLHVKRNERQEVSAAVKRRDFVDGMENEAGAGVEKSAPAKVEKRPARKANALK